MSLNSELNRMVAKFIIKHNSTPISGIIHEKLLPSLKKEFVIISELPVPNLTVDDSSFFMDNILIQTHNQKILNSFYITDGHITELNYINILEDLKIDNSCKHSNKKINYAGGTAFWYCPNCKKDLGDV
jgi:hypothetical protein